MRHHTVCSLPCRSMPMHDILCVRPAIHLSISHFNFASRLKSANHFGLDSIWNKGEMEKNKFSAEAVTKTDLVETHRISDTPSWKICFCQWNASFKTTLSNRMKKKNNNNNTESHLWRSKFDSMKTKRARAPPSSPSLFPMANSSHLPSGQQLPDRFAIPSDYRTKHRCQSVSRSIQCMDAWFPPLSFHSLKVRIQIRLSFKISFVRQLLFAKKI